jgi:geranylgeranyl transferase type-2 subunit beta
MNDLSFWRGAADFVKGRAAPPADIIECSCLLEAGKLIAERAPTGRRGETPAGVMDAVRSFSTRSGGYARMPGGPAGVYHTFLAAQCSRLGDCDLPGAGEAAAFVMSRRCADGGYADSAPSDHAPGRTGGKEGEGGTNPTAAAVTLLAMLGVLDGAAASEAAGFLASMQRAEGGFAPCAGAPAADLLSTFTALVALDGLGALHMVKLAPVARFVQSHEAAGGFRGSSGDDAPDVEYTYYGLGTLGLLGWTAAHTNRTEWPNGSNEPPELR